MKKLSLVVLLVLAMLCMPASAEKALPEVGDVVEGFKVTAVSRFEMIGADLVQFTHEKTGAELLYIANDDTNRVFDITFRTPALDDTGTPHVFEHSTLDGSRKYPSQALFFNLSYQTYNTYMNASTYNYMTTYPVASLSEAQLLAYADYYTDSCLNPILMDEESIFSEEAWRYNLNSAEDELTLAGTVYSEMLGAMSLSRTASVNFLKTVLPGSTKANVSGGLPAAIPSLTYEALCAYHDAYYHPSNSLTCLYGSFEDYTAFLKLLDGYFSQYEKREIVIEDSAYTPIAENVEAVFNYPLEAGADETNGSVVYYGIVCGDATQADVTTMDLLTTLLSEDSSAMAQAMKEKFPTGSFSCYIDNTAPEAVLVFVLDGVNLEDAAPFRATVDEMLVRTAQEGFDPDSVEAVEVNIRMSTLLIGETSDLGVSVIPNFASCWALENDIHSYEKTLESYNHFVDCNNDGTFTELINRLLLDNPRTALVTTVPSAGLKEVEDAALAEKLAATKAAMSAEEIEAIVAKNAALAEPAEDDASVYVAQLQAVTVESLPEEARIYDISETTENGVRYVTADANTDGVGVAMMLLDASGFDTESLLSFKLYTDLLGELDTATHTRAQLASLTVRYLYDGVIKVSLFDSDDEDGLHTYLRTTFTALDEDLPAGYDVIYELVYESDVTDVQRLKDLVAASITSLKKSMTSSAYTLNIYRAYAKGDVTSAAYNYLNFIDYYHYLLSVQERLETAPETVIAELQAVQKALHNAYGAIVAYAGNAEGAEKNRAAADAFLARLENEPVEAKVCVFPLPAASEAIILDSSVQYNLIYATYEELGLEEYEGAMEAVTALVTDTYLYPLLRDQYGVYGVLHFAADSGVLIESYRDPNIAETYAVYDALPELVAATEVSQEELDNYILSSYSAYAQGTGELSGASSAILTVLSGEKQERVLDRMHSLKTVTAENFKEYAKLYALLMEKGLRITSGGAGAIGKYAENYDVILDPFGAAEAKLPADLEADDVYAEAARMCREYGMMSELSADLFGVNEPATLGDLATVWYVAVGGDQDTEAALAFWVGNGLLAGAVDDPLSREELAAYSYNLLLAVGIELEEVAPEGYADCADVDEGAQGAMGVALMYELMLPTEDGLIAPKAPATRGEVAFYIMGVIG